MLLLILGQQKNKALYKDIAHHFKNKNLDIPALIYCIYFSMHLYKSCQHIEISGSLLYITDCQSRFACSIPQHTMEKPSS